MSDYRPCRYCGLPMIYGSVYCERCGLYAPTGGKPVRYLDGCECRSVSCRDFREYRESLKHRLRVLPQLPPERCFLLLSPPAAGPAPGPDEAGPSPLERVTGPSPACRTAACRLAEQHNVPAAVITLSNPGESLSSLLRAGTHSLFAPDEHAPPDRPRDTGVLLVENMQLATDYGELRDCGEPSRRNDWPWPKTCVLAHVLGESAGPTSCELTWPVEKGGVERFQAGGGVWFVSSD